ncbi:hypothetical protein V5O48_002184 [Marasmius crinis-equi]|uniref:F-box domain-containing protein n=1 Tax=Marasmius crinis-equi TaxID=585013 RepID=A0ABR3FX48_9AGAR
MLPTELCEAIIEYCQDDTRLLSSCALVCKAWLPKTRHLLFSKHEVYLYTDNADAFCGLPRTLKAQITAVDLNGFSFTHPTHRQNPRGILTLSRAFIHQCTSLRSLKLRGAELVFPRFTQSLITTTLTTLVLVGDLKGRRTKKFSVQAGRILDLVGKCAALKHLSMFYETPWRYVDYAVEPQTDDRYPGLSRSKKTTLRFLRNLKVNLPWSVFVPWFLVPGVLDSPNVERLEIANEMGRAEEQIPILKTYIESFSSSLKDLTLSLLYWNNIPGYIPRQKIYPHNMQKLLDIVESTREGKGEGELEPLTVIVTVPSDTVDPPDIEGVTWIFDSGLCHEDYHGNESEE